MEEVLNFTWTGFRGVDQQDNNVNSLHHSIGLSINEMLAVKSTVDFSYSVRNSATESWSLQ